MGFLLKKKLGDFTKLRKKIRGKSLCYKLILNKIVQTATNVI